MPCSRDSSGVCCFGHSPGFRILNYLFNPSVFSQTPGSVEKGIKSGMCFRREDIRFLF